MPTRTSKRTGEVQELRDGQWVTVRPGAGGPAFSIPGKPADPLLGGQKIIQSQTITKNAQDIGAAPYEITGKQLDNRGKELDLKIKEKELQQGAQTPKLTAAERAAAIAGYSSAQALRDKVDDMYRQFNAGPGSTSGFMGLQDYFPTELNQRFDNAGNAARGVVGQALGFTGSQLNTPRETEAAVGPYLPQAGDRDGAAKDKMQRLYDLADQAEARSIAILGGRPDVNGNITPVDQVDRSALPPQTQGDTGGRMENATGQTRREIDPFLKAVADRAGGMLAKGASKEEVLRFVRSNGVDPTSTNLDEIIRYRNSPEGKQWLRDNPGRPFGFVEDFYTKEVPVTGLQTTMGNAANSDGGAYLMSAANAVTANQMGNVLGQQGRTALELARQDHPMSSMLGDASGQLMFEATAGRLPGISALKGRRFSQIGGDLAYGAAYGTGEDPSIEGAASGAASTAGGGVIGRGLMRGGGAMLRGVDNPSLNYLNARDVPLTIGQIGRGSGSTLGNAIGGIEERISRWPIADAIVGGARQRGDVGWNREMMRQVGGPIGVRGSGSVGEAGLADARNTRGQAYSFLDNALLSRDAPFVADDSALRATIPGLPDFGDKVTKKLDLIGGAFDPAGNMTGRNWQSSVRSLRGDRGKTAALPFGQEAADAMGQAENNLMGLVNRQLPGGAQQLANANAVNANYKTVQSALKGRVAQRAGVLTDPTTLNDAAIRGATKFGGIDNALTGNRPFADLTRAGMEVMPTLTPDSGTAGQAILYSGLAGALGGGGGAAIGGGVGAASGGDIGDSAAQGGGIGLGTTLIPTLALAALYSKHGQKGFQKALLGPRSKLAKQLGAGMRNGMPVNASGDIGAAIARALLIDQNYDPNR